MSKKKAIKVLMVKKKKKFKQGWNEIVTKYRTLNKKILRQFLTTQKTNKSRHFCTKHQICMPLLINSEPGSNPDPNSVLNTEPWP